MPRKPDQRVHLNVLVVPDKFKGTLTAAAAAAAIAKGWASARPQDRLAPLPMSDGGDGFGEILGDLLGAETLTVDTVDAARQPCASRWRWHAPSRTAIVESAQVIGLARLPPGRYHPFELDTFGLGALVHAVASLHPRRCLVGIGGSATNDGGFGLARALGWRFLAGDRSELLRWTDLSRLHTLAPPPQPSALRNLTVAVDVQNILLGPAGSTRVYGPQKGLRPDQLADAEASLARLADTVSRELHPDLHLQPGTGAAGGLGFGLRAFAGARLEPGFDVFASVARLRERLRGVDVVITGEGAIDASSLMGKGVGELARLCARQHVPCIGLGGQVGDAARAARLFHRLEAIAPHMTTPEQALERAAYWLEQLAARTARQWNAA
ncbi:MAG: glycerate kinase [Verrucomicrobia bacterium]|nr:glycerate kinase [Verrucomicrobiota bacterium]